MIALVNFVVLKDSQHKVMQVSMNPKELRFQSLFRQSVLDGLVIHLVWALTQMLQWAHQVMTMIF